MKWIKAHKLLAGITCTALVLCLVIVLSFLNKGNIGVIGRQIENFTALIQKPIAAVSYEVRDGIFRLRSLIAENEELKDENARLRSEINSIMLRERDLEELRKLADVLDYDIEAYDYKIIAANVISIDGTNWFNIFTIDKGTDDGIYADAIVVNGDGLIGTVIDVGKSWAKIISVIDEAKKVSFIVFRDPDLIGILEGDGNGGLSGYMLDNQAGIIVGDILITSGIGMQPMYPRGITIGRVTSVNYNTDTQLKTITIEPSVKFGNLRKVAVLI
jgi:rod shape-determining protein MreC